MCSRFVLLTLLWYTTMTDHSPLQTPCGRRTRFSFRWLLLLTLPLVGVMAASARWSLQRVIRSDSTLKISSENLDFGTVWAQPAFSWTLHVWNLTSEDIHIARTVGSCRCVSFAPNEFVVPARSSIPLTVTLDLLPYTSEDSLNASRSFSTSFRFELDSTRTAPPPWTLHGTVRNALALVPREVDFRRVSNGSAEIQTKVVKVRPRK